VSQTNWSFVVSYSTNGGTNWTRCNLSGSSTGLCYTVAVAPSQTEIVYAGGEVSGFGAVYRSTNNGSTWTRTNQAPIETVFSLVVHPRNPDFIYAATPGGVYRSTDAGNSWTNLLARRGMRTIKIFPDAPDTIVAAGDYGVMFSTDGGAHWQEMNDGLECLRITSLEFVHAPELSLLAGTANGAGYRWTFSTGVNELSDSKPAPGHIVPNPARQSVFVQINQPVVRLALYDAQGRKVWGGSSARTVTIDVSRLPNGVYHLEAQTARGRWLGRFTVAR